MPQEYTMDLARKVKSDLSETITFKKLFLIGNFQKVISLNNELDFVVVIRDNSNKFLFVKQTENLAVKYLSNYQFMFQFFPVYQSDFELKSSAFIKSVHNYGIEIL